MRNKNVVALFTVLTLIFSLLTGTTFGNTFVSEQNIIALNDVQQRQVTESNLLVAPTPQNQETAFVRIEADTVTIVPKTEVTLEDFDLKPYHATKSIEGIVAFQGIIRALESLGLDATDEEVLQHSGGSYISGVCGLTQGSTSGWMYTVNGKAPSLAVNEQEIKAGDQVVLYYIEDWMRSSYAYFTQEEASVAGGDSLELTLMNDVLDMNTWESSSEPCEEATILVDDTEYGKTDEKGKIKLTFNEKGTHYISASKLDEDGTQLISRPYCKVEVTSDYKDAAMMTALKITPSARTIKPEFRSDIYEYNMELPCNVSSFYSYPTLQDTTSNVYAIGSWEESTFKMSQTGAIIPASIPPGKSTLTYKVEPIKSEYTARTYTIHINRLLASDANLSSLVLSSGTAAEFNQATSNYKDGTLYRCVYDSNSESYNPSATTGYNKNVLNYYAQVNYYVDKLCIKPTLGSSTPAGYGEIEITNETTGEKVKTTSGTASSGIYLNEGENKLKIVSIAQDGVASQSYYLTVKRLKEVGLQSIRIDGGYIEPTTLVRGSTICAQIKPDTTSFTIKIEASDDSAEITLNGQKIESGVATTISDIGTGSWTNKALKITSGDITASYKLSIYRHNPEAASRVEEYVSAPGQYASGVAGYVVNADTTLRKEASLISLGGYGGYVTYAFDQPIENSPENPYGIDFIVQGNSMVNTSTDYYRGTTTSFAEPGAVMVAEDAGNGKPAKWYQLAPSNYYEDNVIKDYTRTYTKETSGYATETDNKGNLEGIINHKYLYTANNLYDAYNRFYQTEPAVGIEKVELPGGYGVNGGIFLIGTDETLGNGEHQFSAKDITFGYADVHKNGNGNSATNPYKDPNEKDYWTETNGDGFDLDWAVDKSGKPVKLDKVSFIKVYTASGYLSGFGEKSTEITSILRASQNKEAVGKTEELERLEITSIDKKAVSYITKIELKKDVYDYIVPIYGEEITNLKVEGLPENIYIGNEYVKDGNLDVSYKLPKDGLVRVIAQDGNKEPIIYVFKFIKSQKPNTEEKGFEYNKAIRTAQDWIQKQVDFNGSTYAVGSTPDWNAFAVARAGGEVPEAYYQGIQKMIKGYESIDAFKKEMTKVTEYERMAIGITASGHDATNVEGINFIESIYNSDVFTKQGVNGVIYGLLAIDSHPYNIPENAVYTRNAMVRQLLEQHIDGAGWAYFGKTSDIDLTAMAIQALAPYYRNESYAENKQVKTVVDEAIAYLSSVQKKDGTYVAYGAANAESIAQVIVALSSLGIDCMNDMRFIKEGNTLFNALEAFYNTKDGGFKHSLTGASSNTMATGQVLYGLTAYRRLKNNENTLYDLSDVTFKTSMEKENIIYLNNEEKASLSKEKIKIVIADGFNEVKLDTRKVKDTFPETTIIFDENEIALTEGMKLSPLVDELKLKRCVPQNLTSYKSQLTGIKDIEYAFEFGIDQDINCSDWITMTLKGRGMNEAGYIDAGGKVHKIVKAPKNLQGLSEYCIAKGNDLIIKTKHLTTFFVYNLNTGVTPSENQEQTINICIDVDAQTISKGYLVGTKSLKVKKDSTVFEVLKSLGLSLKTTGADASVYIAAINGIGEFDHGALSGWMYSVNGKFPNISLGKYTLSEGDVVKVCYTTNGGKDLGDKAAELFESSSGGGGGNAKEVSKAYTDVIESLLQILKNKESLSEWEVIGLAQRAQLSDKIKKQLVTKVSEAKGDYRKVTDLERMIIALGAAGYDAQNTNGLNLAEKLYNRESVTLQGVNGVIFALIALDSKEYNIPQTAVWTREKLTETLIAYQNKDGGFGLSKGEVSNTDLTAMALCALEPYRKQTQVEESVTKALVYLSKIQNPNGEFSFQGVESSESTAQVIIALTTLGINPTTDKRFIKGDKDLLDILMNYYVKDEGFKHIKTGKVDDMATEQALLGLLSYEGLLQKKTSIYKYDEKVIEAVQNEEINSFKELEAFKDNKDVAAWAKEEMAEAIRLGIVKGRNNEIEPKEKVTRAEFVTMLLRTLNQPVKEVGKTKFKDVPINSWYSQEVYTANELKLIEGISKDVFMPDKTITREQMAVILNRMQHEEAGENSPVDISEVSGWAQDAVKAIYTSGLMQGNGNKFLPEQEVTREMAIVILMRSYKMSGK